MMRHPRKGDRVLVERDEFLYPGKGTWSRFRGRTGTVVSVNRDSGLYRLENKVRIYRRRPDSALNEYGVSFIRTGNKAAVDAWFRLYELTVLASQSVSGPR